MNKAKITIQAKLAAPTKIQTSDLVGLFGPCTSGATPSSELTITTDSRKANTGSVFFCYAGTNFDPHTLLSEKLINSIGALICEKAPNIKSNTPIWVVKNARAAWTKCCQRAWDNPEKNISHWGVTGTNGKTSVTQMTSALLSQTGKPHLVLGTLGAELKFLESNAEKAWRTETSHTTPDPDVLAALLHEALQSNCNQCVMEVASQSILHEKLVGMRFKFLAFTSFSQDHLDLHETMENYFRVKMDFFIRYAESDASMFIHVSVFDRFLHAFKPHQKPAQRIVAYGLIDEFEQISQHTPQHSFALSRDSRTISVEQKVDEEVVWSKKLPNNTHFDSLSLTNLCCSLAMIKTADLLGGDSELVTDQVQVRGRFEKVLAGDGKKPYVFVDYAHTPDALEKVLRNGRHYLSALPKSLSNSASAELWVVFGCGGDRDKGKRPLMGSAALQFADRAVVTSDNPRTESPEGIIADIVAADMEEKLHAEPNREVAINYALSNAKPGDCVIIAGKGHETTQIVGDQVIAFDDAEKVRQWASNLSS